MANKPFSEKENLIRVYKHDNPLWLAGGRTAKASSGFTCPIEKGSMSGNGYDGFGVHWINFIPEPNNYVLTDVTKWREQVKFPDVEAFDWQAQYELEMANINRDEVFYSYGSGNGPFERLAALMGFENTLIALYEEPEATKELVEAIVDYKIQVVKKVASIYHPDAWCSFDDVATANRLFMSPETYRAVIKPATQRYYDAVRECGMMAIQHVCGRWEELIEDYIEMGCVSVEPVQPVNDIAGLLKKYGDKITICGGYDTSGLPGSVDYATDDMLRAEVRRCLDEYGFSPSFIFSGFVMGRGSDNEVDNASERALAMAAVINDEFLSYSKKFDRF